MQSVTLRKTGIVGTFCQGLSSQMRARRRSIPPPPSSLMLPQVLNLRRTVTPLEVRGCTHKRSSFLERTPMRVTRLTS